VVNFATVCSGIEAPSVAWPEWNPVFFSEIEPFPCAVLKHHYPNVPNLGDMEKYKEWPDYDLTDGVICAGTPCQAFSVAGLRKGLDDPRGNLTLVFLGILERYKPKYFLWENVPGVISDKTGALKSFLDGVEELGYVIDIDIIDAQFNGVPQRRRRLFVCGHRISCLLNQKTISSGITVAQCLIECLRFALGVRLGRLSREQENLKLNGTKSIYLLKRRMKLFGMDLENQALLLQENLDALLPLLEAEQKESALENGRENIRSITDIKLLEQAKEEELQNTEESLRCLLGKSLIALRSFTTLTSGSEITESTIFMFAKTLLLIARLITQYTASSPTFWSAATSCLITLQEYMNYARSASSSLFTDVEWLQPWGDFVEQAEQTIKIIGNIGVENFGEILPVSSCLQRHSPPGRKAGKGTAADVAPSLTSSGRGVERTGESRGQDPVIAHTTGNGYWQEGFGTLRAREQDSHENVIALHGTQDPCISDVAFAQGRNSGQENVIAHSLRAEGFDASEDGTGRGTPLVCGTMKSCSKSGGWNNSADHSAAGYMIPVVKAHGKENVIAFGGNNTSGPIKTATACNAKGGSGRMDFESETFIAFSCKDNGRDSGETSPTIRAGGHVGSHAIGSHANGGIGPAIAFKPGQSSDSRSIGAQEDVACTIEAGGGGNNKQAIAFAQNQRDEVRLMNVSGALAAEPGAKQQTYALQSVNCPRERKQNGIGISSEDVMYSCTARDLHGIQQGMQVRRLTPLECARLQGFPDDYLDIPFRGKPAADGPKYKALGNSMAVPVVRWLGQRIEMVNNIK
jgi:DNA-cytosine methyltransferase